MKISAKGQYQWWSIATYILFGLMAGSLMMSGFFVYNYTFRTLEDAHTIVLLNTDTVVNNVNIDQYNKAVKAITEKTKSSGFNESIRNIFSFGFVPPAPSAPTSSSSTPAQNTTSTAVYGFNQSIQ